jgi:transcription initiation factor IIE alpha subunit
MIKIEVLCPMCGIRVVLSEYGRYLSKDMRSFEHFYEGWCPKCAERLVAHKNLLGSREYRVSAKESKESNQGLSIC